MILLSAPPPAPDPDWIGGERDPEATRRAWSAAVGLPLDLVKRGLPVPVFRPLIPMCSPGLHPRPHLARFFPLFARAPRRDRLRG